MLLNSLRRSLLIVAALLVPASAFAQFPSQNITLPAFVIPASAVNGGGTVTSAQLLAPDGTAAAPAYSFASDPDTGRFTTIGNSFFESFGGVAKFYYDANTLAGASGVSIGWSNNTNVAAGSVDVSLSRRAARNPLFADSTNAYRLDVANTYTSNISNEVFSVDWQTVANNALVGCRTAATGTTRNCRFVTQNTNGADAYAMLELSYTNGATFGLTTNAGAFAASKWNLNASGTETVTQATLAVNVQTLTTLATNDDPVENVRQQRVTTTDATPTTIDTITIPATTTVGISCTVINRRTGGVSGTAEDGAYYEVKVAMKNVAGTATEIAAEVLTVIGESIAGYTVTAAPSGATELIQVTGAATTNITWHSTCRTYLVGS